MTNISATEPAPTSVTTATPSSAGAVYRHHDEAEEAVRRLERGRIPMHRISIISWNFQLREDVQDILRNSAEIELTTHGPKPSGWTDSSG